MTSLFLSRYLNCADVESLLKEFSEEFLSPVCAEIVTLGTTPEGRNILALHVWPQGKHASQPTLWIDANMHAAEIIGTNVVFAQIHSLISHLKSQRKSMYSKRNYIFVPRICPDGAERYFSDGLVSRSNPRDSRDLYSRGSFWRRECLVPKPNRNITGLGVFSNPERTGIMRRENPAGCWTMDAEYPALLRRREIGDEAPFFDVFPEGMIENFDGKSIPRTTFLEANEVDLNRNFSAHWTADEVNSKSGPFSLSESESLAITSYASRFPEIYFWMNYHTHGGVFIRPPDHEPDSKLPRLDASIYEFLDKEFERLTGYPSVSGAKEFQYTPGVPLPGTATSFAYYSRGAYAYVCELWDLIARLEHTERPFIHRYTQWRRADWKRLYLFDQDFNQSVLFGCPWQSFEHPQLGNLEISEFPAVYGMQNPPQHLIAEVVLPQLKIFDLLVEIAPEPSVDAHIVRGKEGSGVLRVAVSNQGFLPTCVSEQGQISMGKWPLTVEIKPSEAVCVLVPNTVQFGDLGGYAPINTGWLDLPGNGSVSQTSVVFEFPFKMESLTDPCAFQVSVRFARAGKLEKRVF